MAGRSIASIYRSCHAKLLRINEPAKPSNTDNFRTIMLIIFAVSGKNSNFTTAMYNKKIPIDINCGFRIAIEVMGGKWKPYIIYELLSGPKRPSELRRRMPEASERVLAQQLKELVEYGVVEKNVINPICKHSEYRLTDLGRTLIPIIEQLHNWGNKFRPRMEQILKEKEG